MAKSLKQQVENINALGRQQLTQKGVAVTGEETTHELMNMISNIVGSEIIYSDISYNDDNSISLTELDGTTHTLMCIYEDDKITSFTWDNENITVYYDIEGNVVKVGNTEVDLTSIPSKSGADMQLNIAYGDVEPTDTSKLWIKAEEPQSLIFGSDFEGIESIETIGNLPTAVSNMGCAKVGNKVYLFGGQSASSTYLDTINVFDTEIQTVVTLDAVLPIACSSIACASVGNKVYLFGGYNGATLDTVSMFDTETQTITALDITLPAACSNICCASIGNKVYLLGGSSLKTINVFDPELETITTLSATLPVDYTGRGYASVGSKIYLFGGYYYSMGATYSNRIDVFDTETQTVTQLSTKLPATRQNIACTSIGTKIYLFGGKNKNVYDTIFVFDAITETITTLEITLPTSCYSSGCISVGNNIYLFGGYSSNYLNIINKFTLTHELTQNNIEVITGYKNFFNIVNTDAMKVEIGINSVLIGDENNQAKKCDAYLYQNDMWIQL